MRGRWLVLLLLVAGCDRTPESVTKLAAARLDQVRSYMRQMQQRCTNAGPQTKVDDWGGLDSDSEVLNVQVKCKLVKGLGMPVQLPSLRPTPTGDRSGTPYRVGSSKGKDPAEDPFPVEQVLIPSFISDDKGAMDLCVRSGHPDDADYTEVCVAFRVAR